MEEYVHGERQRDYMQQMGLLPRKVCKRDDLNRLRCSISRGGWKTCYVDPTPETRRLFLKAIRQEQRGDDYYTEDIMPCIGSNGEKIGIRMNFLVKDFPHSWDLLLVPIDIYYPTDEERAHYVYDSKLIQKVK